MDAIDNPDHGRATFEADGIRVVNKTFDPSKALNTSAPAGSGGPVFPPLEDVQISSAPS